jgi:hypothetical protein
MPPQQTGVPFIITQQVQPSFIIVVMQAQQAWIISMHFGSPLVQVMVQPLSVGSQVHRPIVRLQQQAIMPFIMQQQEHMPPWSIWQRFCTMLAAILSSQVQVIFIPPWHFSIFTVQRGTIIMDGIICAPMPPMGPGAMPMPGMPMPIRSIIIVPVMVVPSGAQG